MNIAKIQYYFNLQDDISNNYIKNFVYNYQSSFNQNRISKKNLNI